MGGGVQMGNHFKTYPGMSTDQVDKNQVNANKSNKITL